MQHKTTLIYFVLFASFLFLSVSLAEAQLGEVAGQPFFNVSIGSSKSLTVTIINEGSSPLPFKIILPTLNTIANTTQPVVTASPMGGAIPAQGSMKINVTVQMPSDKRNMGHTWTGILQIVEVNNATSSGGMGAVIVAGVAKIVTIYASKPVFNPLPYIIAGIVAVVVVVGGGSYYLHAKRKAAKAARLKAAKRIAKKVKGKRAKPRRKAAKKATARKRTTRRRRR